jgi:carboxylesterase type B
MLDIIRALTISSASPSAAADFLKSSPGSEDCLFLNVYAPADATNLPVLVWIHGGGYGLQNGQQDMTHVITSNDNGFIAVTIQYRVSSTWAHYVSLVIDVS